MTGSLPDLGRKWVGEPDYIDRTSLFSDETHLLPIKPQYISHISDKSDVLVYIFSPQCDKCGKVGTCV